MIIRATATVTGVKEMHEAVKNFIDKTEEQANDLKCDMADVFFRAVVNRSPVKTGTFCINNRIGIGRPNLIFNQYIGRRSRADAMARARRHLRGLTRARKMPLETPIYITNRTPYGPLLENGWSRQAPMGIYRLAWAETKFKFAIRSR